jgi:endo-1,4-beta-D-glucanase Y
MSTISVSAKLDEKKTDSYKGILNIKNNSSDSISNWSISFVLPNGSSIFKCENFKISGNKLIPKDKKFKTLKPNFNRGVKFRGDGEMPTEFSVNIEKPFPDDPPTPTPSSLKKFNIIKATNSSFNQIENFYKNFKNKYIKRYNTGAYLDFSSGNYVSVSEGQGWLIMISAMMYDKEIFDASVNYYVEFRNSNKLMSWRQTLDPKTNKISVVGDDKSSATDGDMDIIYGLYLGYLKWNNERYLNLAKESLQNFKNLIIHKTLFSLKLGDWALDNDKKYGNLMRSSDLIPVHIHTFKKIDPSFNWNKVLTTILKSSNDIFRKSSLSTGLLPDFMIYENNSWNKVNGKVLESDLDGEYNWNACRIFMRLSTLFCFQEDNNLKEQLKVSNNFIKNISNNNPQNIKAAYYLDGRAINTYSSLAFTSPFIGSAIISNDQEWLDKLYNYILNAPFENYYEDTIRMLCLILGSGNFEYPV